jgi:arginine/ornithine transport system permease protein
MMLDYFKMVLSGGWLTLSVALAALLFSLAFGLVAAIFKTTNSRLLHRLVDGYTQLVRGIPDLVLMLIVFYGSPIAVAKFGELFGADWHLDLPPFLAGSLTIGFIFGAYMAETFRGALLAIPRGEIEAAMALGMSGAQVWTIVRLPQMLRFALPGFTNNWLTLVKGTAIVSVIGLQDVVFRAGAASQATREPFTFYIISLFVYLLITAVSLLGLRALAKHYRCDSIAQVRFF